MDLDDTAPHHTAVEQGELDDASVQKRLSTLARAGLENAALGLSEMIGQKITMTVPRVTVVPIAGVPARVGGPEARVVAVYLATEGELTGHVMLIMAPEAAAELIDLLLGPGDCREGTRPPDFDPLARSALAEAGNLTASYFLNAVSTLLGWSVRPSPPAVIVDMAGAVLDIMLVAAGQLGDDVVLIETVFEGEGRQLHIFFWVLPDLMPLRTLALASLEEPGALGGPNALADQAAAQQLAA